MTPEQIALAAGAVVVALWPQIQAAGARAMSAVRRPAPAAPAAPTPVDGVGFESAVHNLALVRSRLLATALLAEEQRKAIDTLTLALVAGSDK
jgi:hypothetical protein